MTNAAGQNISLVTMWNIVNQLGKHDFSCGAVVNSLKEETFSNQMNSNLFVLILERRESTLCSCLNVKELLARNRRDILNLSTTTNFTNEHSTI